MFTSGEISKSCVYICMGLFSKSLGIWKDQTSASWRRYNQKRRLLSHVQSQMMKYFGHIARRGGNSLEKVIMQGCVEGRRKPGRPRTRWIDQIKSMVGCPLHELYNLVQDRQRWCDVVAVASCQSWQDHTDRPIFKIRFFFSSSFFPLMEVMEKIVISIVFLFVCFFLSFFTIS